METLEDLTFYFYVSCGIVAAALIVLFIFVTIIFVRLNRLISDKSNQLARQKEMMADFCYTNPTIVPGEELSRRGFSMYSGTNHHHFATDEFDIVNGKDYTHQDEGRSKF
ncbi:uncharacterized protein LOC105690751 [Athalia rosae]|uniref:uncharacterized protein LOC105690751 n=1 Tax=Athalia rosae TaxID=37344 RepID=UPI0006269DE9|nr:uncharacterized protein LOC105690751 [Athalia rosae]